nr:hypothetical protein [uncultured Roseobacter sp.]
MKLLLQLVIWHEDDQLLAAFALHEDLASVRRDVANLQIRQFTDPQPSDDLQLDGQERDGILRSWRGVDRTAMVR